MIEPIPGLPDNAIGFTASGTVTAEDYEQHIIPAVDALVASAGKVRFLYHLGAEFESFDLGAAWDDARLGLRHMLDWEKIAVVTDKEWISNTVRVFGVIMPGEVRVFGNQDLDKAKVWIAS